MSVIQIQTGAENQVLREKAKKVPQINRKILNLVASMKETMLVADGLGLAAPQVGESLSIIVCRFDLKMSDERVSVMINPEIIWTSRETCFAEEGCLSLPKQFEKVERAVSIRVRFQDEKGIQQVLEFSGFNARVVQHEIDHLHGILFIDYLNEKAATAL